MRKLRNTKEAFMEKVLEKVKSNEWGLEELEYLNENHSNYQLKCEDIGFLLLQAYRYSYQLAIEDGVVTPDEQKVLSDINVMFMQHIPTSRQERDLVKAKIFALTKSFDRGYKPKEQANLTTEPANLTTEPANSNTLAKVEAADNEMEQSLGMKEKISTAYYRLPTPYPKLTPYTY